MQEAKKYFVGKKEKKKKKGQNLWILFTDKNYSKSRENLVASIAIKENQKLLTL